MKKLTVLILGIAISLTLAGCGNQKNSEIPIDIADFKTVGYDYEPGDFKYQFELTKKQQAEFEKLLQTEKWVEETEPLEFGLHCVATAKSS